MTDQWEADQRRLREFQDGRCFICGEGRAGLVLDHDHASGLARGYLCGPCNVAEGLDLGDVDWDEYRRNPPARQLGIVQHVRGGMPNPTWALCDHLRAIDRARRCRPSTADEMDQLLLDVYGTVDIDQAVRDVLASEVREATERDQKAAASIERLTARPT